MITKEDLLANMGSADLQRITQLHKKFPQLTRQTFNNWIEKGFNGHHLVAIRIGSHFFTTEQAIREFIHAINAD